MLWVTVGFSRAGDLIQLTSSFWRSVAFFNTSAYTRFFSRDDALRMKSEKRDDATGFGVKIENIAVL